METKWEFPGEPPVTYVVAGGGLTLPLLSPTFIPGSLGKSPEIYPGLKGEEVVNSHRRPTRWDPVALSIRQPRHRRPVGSIGIPRWESRSQSRGSPRIPGGRGGTNKLNSSPVPRTKKIKEEGEKELCSLLHVKNSWQRIQREREREGLSWQR